MIRSLLIANRGEIAVRIIRTCKEMGIRTVAVYSEADTGSLHTQMADQAVCIGPAASQDSYLNIRNIITAACATRCDAIHPGVGFLSENAKFAEAVEQAGFIFVGPTADTIRMLGDKVRSRHTATEAGVPVTPGSMEPVTDAESASVLADEIGYPVILKAAAGGGGRGMRIVREPKELAKAMSIASREALSFFADGTIHMEKYLLNPRHVEIQLLSDGKGHVVHLGERDCSVQKNHQKLIEESPSPIIDETMRRQMGADSVRLFSHIGYRGAGTIEFLVEDGSYWFMEVNARVQVEHPVTEMVCATDIIRQQLLIASGKSIELDGSAAKLTGHAMECRVNALTPGTVTTFVPPLGPSVRVDTHLFQGAQVSPHYDSMVAKVIVHGPDRQRSIDIMLRALREFKIEGIKTNIESQITILQSKPFRSGMFGTDLYARLFDDSKR